MFYESIGSPENNGTTSLLPIVVLDGKLTVDVKQQDNYEKT